MMNHIQQSEIWSQIKDVWVMCSLSKLRVSHTVIPYSFPCCIPLSEIGMDLSSGLFCAGCQLQTMVSTGSRDDRLPGQMYDELVTGDGFGDGLVMVW